MDKIENLNITYLKSKGDENFLMTKTSIPEEKKFFVGSLEFVNVNYALYNIFIKSKYEEARLSFYRAGMVAAYLHEKYNEDIFLINFFTYPVLSDSSDLMARFLRYKTGRWGNTFAYFYGKAIQAILTDNRHDLNENIIGLEKTCKKGWEKQYSGLINAFKGLKEDSPSLIKEGVEEILSKHKKQDKDELLKKFMNLEATAILKLALHKNLDVKVNNSLIPKEFIPISELREYTGYDFFKEIE